MSQREAVMIILEKEGKFLLGKRSELKSKAPGFWCPISGHIEPNESEEGAVVREAWEEVGLMVRPYRKFTSMKTHDGSTMLHWWHALILEGEPFIKNNENSELGWFTVDELKELQPTFREDIELILQIIEKEPQYFKL